MNTTLKQLAINGADPTFTDADINALKENSHWPIITAEDEAAVIQVMRDGTMSEGAITREFEDAYAAYTGAKYAIAVCNGTAGLEAAFYACGVAAGDEVICPSMTYWASCTSVLTLGAAVNFADIDKDSLCIDPADIEHRIGPRTKAIVVVHYAGHPCDMDPIMEIAKRKNVKVIEDVSHAQGSLYKGSIVGSIGDIAVCSMMGGKSFAVGEGGMITTDNEHLFQACISYGHYERTGLVTEPELVPFKGIPMGGKKHRMNQMCSALGLGQLKHYPERIAEIQKALNYFWDLLSDVPGIKAHRPADENSTMGGWYTARGLFRSDELNGLSCEAFCKAVTAEGLSMSTGANFPLHLHNVFQEMDFFNTGKPTMVSFTDRDVRQGEGSLPVSESISNIAFGVPWFKRYDEALIEKAAAVIKRVAENADQIKE
ncbi:MAG: DegT/DnrJ/EryC1/StrS family aminotransferase [Lentisphaeria bacterium]|nr:DegT/DnrJ/EryC1/StrS family aminotransferase [Lentisphaeria bacterium]NQZ69729.1 DegT/DnrJ/EryC1/StrS family aminotransferase [Lentisphaeria bacterium]